MSCFENQRMPRNSETCGCNCENNGILQMLQKILTAQECAEIIQEQDEFCDRATLGCCQTQECNTRPIRLFSCNGEPLLMEYTLDDVTTTTNIFRIEKINGCVCTFRCLAPNPDETSTFPYVKTNDFFSINMGCCCKILKCLDDTRIECL